MNKDALMPKHATGNTLQAHKIISTVTSAEAGPPGAKRSSLKPSASLSHYFVQQAALFSMWSITENKSATRCQEDRHLVQQMRSKRQAPQDTEKRQDRKPRQKYHKQFQVKSKVTPFFKKRQLVFIIKNSKVSSKLD